MTGCAAIRNLEIPGLVLTHHPGMTFFQRHTSTLPRRKRDRVMIVHPPEEGVGNAGWRAHPQPHVRNKKAHELVTAGSAGITRHSRTRMVLTVSFVLFPVSGHCCHRHP
jgi:hypothetical protein